MCNVFIHNIIQFIRLDRWKKELKKNPMGEICRVTWFISAFQHSPDSIQLLNLKIVLPILLCSLTLLWQQTFYFLSCHKFWVGLLFTRTMCTAKTCPWWLWKGNKHSSTDTVYIIFFLLFRAFSSFLAREVLHGHQCETHAIFWRPRMEKIYKLCH